MHIVADAGVDAMVAAFLVAEASSSRFGTTTHAAAASYGAAPDSITSPDTTDPEANAMRRRVLARCRGFPDREVFTGVPPDTRWYYANFTRADLDSIRYINWDWWLEVTSGTRRPADALHYYRAHPTCQAIASSIRAGEMPPTIILVARPGPIDVVVLEGHLRLTAMHLASTDLPDVIPAILGISPAMDK